MPVGTHFLYRRYARSGPGLAVVMCLMASWSGLLYAEDYFDPDSIERHNGQSDNIDLSGFSHPGGQVAGTYRTEIYVNGNYIDERDVTFVQKNGELAPELLKSDFLAWGVENRASSAFRDLGKNSQVDNITRYIPQSSTRYEFDQQRLDVSIPQEYIRMNAQGTVPPEEWDDGLNMAFVNYGYTGANSWSDYQSGSDNSSYLNLRSGVNLGAWRLRNYTTWTHSEMSDDWDSINTYLQRDIKSLKSQLVIGESYTPSDVFDSFAFRGMQLYSDDNMQPESMRGFAPVIRGIAQSSAQVTIRQDGNVIYQAYVPPGPFSISDLYPTSASEDLQVSVREADGTVRQFVQAFSAVPIMQREGRFKYSITAGKYRATSGAEKKPSFAQATAIYGLPWDSTVYGGSILSEDYQAGTFGAGKGLGILGSVSLDATWSTTKLREERQNGGSFRFQYAKDIAQSGTSFTLAGYRYSTSGYYDFNEANGYYSGYPLRRQQDDEDEEDREQERRAYADWRYQHNKRSKAQININQSMGDYGSLFLSAYRQQYWGVSGKESSVTFGYNFSYNAINYSLNYAWSKTPYYEDTDQVVSFAIQIPFDRFLPNSWLSLAGSTTNHGDSTSSVGLSGTSLPDNNLSWNVQQGYTNRGTGVTGNASADYKARFGEYQAGYNYTRRTRQLNYGVMGGIILHPYGMTLSQPLGDTLALVKADDAHDVKVQNNTGIYTDGGGYAVVPYVTPYRRNLISLDTNSLANNVDVMSDTRTVTPTEGALALAEYPTASGQKIMLNLTSSGTIPFGATASVKNREVTSQGIVDDRQRVYLSGVPQQGTVTVSWQGGSCQAPYHVPHNETGVNLITARCH